MRNFRCRCVTLGSWTSWCTRRRGGWLRRSCSISPSLSGFQSSSGPRSSPSSAWTTMTASIRSRSTAVSSTVSQPQPSGAYIFHSHICSRKQEGYTQIFLLYIQIRPFDDSECLSRHQSALEAGQVLLRCEVRVQGRRARICQRVGGSE